MRHAHSNVLHSIGRQFHFSGRLFAAASNTQSLSARCIRPYAVWPHKCAASKYFINRNKWCLAVGWSESAAACPSVNHFLMCPFNAWSIAILNAGPPYSASARDIIAHYFRYRLTGACELWNIFANASQFFCCCCSFIRFSFLVSLHQFKFNGIRGTAKWLNKRPSHHQDSMLWLHRVASTAPAGSTSDSNHDDDDTSADVSEKTKSRIQTARSQLTHISLSLQTDV